MKLTARRVFWLRLASVLVTVAAPPAFGSALWAAGVTSVRTASLLAVPFCGLLAFAFVLCTEWLDATSHEVCDRSHREWKERLDSCSRDEI